MAASGERTDTSGTPREPRPNAAFRQLRGDKSPREFAAAVRRAAREIGEQVSCDARYIGRVESGEIKCPNYAYERVFRHMFPGSAMQDLGFAPREVVRGKGRRGRPPAPLAQVLERRADAERMEWTAGSGATAPEPWLLGGGASAFGGYQGRPGDHHESDEESDVLRRAFMTGGPAAIAAALSVDRVTAAPIRPGTLMLHPPTHPDATASPGRVGTPEAEAVEQAVRRIRLLDDMHGADAFYARAGRSLRTAYLLLDEGSYTPAVADRLYAGAGELAISVGWLAHDSGRLADARSYYAEALATARMNNNAALEAHAFCNTAFLARDAGRPREAVRAAQAAQQAAKRLSSPRLLSLLTLREAGGWAGLRDRAACERTLLRAERLFAHGPSDVDPEWMSFFGEGELAGLEAQCWSALGDCRRAAGHARRAVALQDSHFVRNIALFTAELAADLAGQGEVAEAAHQGCRVFGLLNQVNSSRIRGMVEATALALQRHHGQAVVADFLDAYRGTAHRATAVSA